MGQRWPLRVYDGADAAFAIRGHSCAMSIAHPAIVAPMPSPVIGSWRLVISATCDFSWTRKAHKRTLAAIVLTWGARADVLPRTNARAAIRSAHRVRGMWTRQGAR